MKNIFLFSIIILIGCLIINCSNSIKNVIDNKSNNSSSSSSNSSHSWSTTGNTYYVAKTDASGDAAKNTNPGTEASPWLTINYAASKLNPGDTVYIKTGIYNEQVTISKSGNSTGGFITFCNYNNDNVIIDGTGINPGYWQGLVIAHGKSYIRIQGLHIRNMKIGSNASLYFSGYGASVSQIEILKVEVYDHSTDIPALLISSGTYPIENVLIDNCTVHDCKTAGFEALRINGDVTNFTITNNIVHDNSNIGIDCVGRNGVGVPSYGIIKYNTCYNNSLVSQWGSGIYLDRANNVTVENNLCYSNDVGITLGNEENGYSCHDNIAKNNICFANKCTNMIVGGSNDTTQGLVSDSIVRNNVLYLTDYTNFKGGGGPFAEMLINYSDNSIIENNIIISNTGETSLGIKTYATNYTIDYNCLYQGYTPGGIGTHNIYTNPELEGPTSDFHIQSSSPCRNTGNPSTVVSSGETDYYGENRVNGIIDIGADEY